MIFRRSVAAFVLLCLPLCALAGVRVQIGGDVSGQEKENIEARLTLVNEAGKRKLDEPTVRRLARQGRAEARESLQPFGYYNSEAEVEVEGGGDDWTVRYTVTMGPVTKFAEVDVQLSGEGASFPAVADTVKILSLQVGRRLVHADYDWSKGKLMQAAYANGFLDARWEISELRIDQANNTAAAVLHLDVGPRYFFGPVTIEQEGLALDFLSRYISIREGDPFDPQQLLDFQFVLSDLDYFQTVEMRPQRDKTDEARRIPILVATTPRPGKRYDFGLGYGTDTGARASVGTEWRRINQYGHKLRTDLRVSQIKNTLGGEYRVPLGVIPGEKLSFTATGEQEELEDGETLKYTLGAAIFRQPGKWQRKLYVEFSHEESEFGDSVTTADLLTPGVSFNRTDADDPIYARKGWYLFTDVHGAQKSVLSSASFLQARVLARAAYPLGHRARVLGRVEFGATVVDDLDELPASQRFFAGGDQSVRGYAYQALGPQDEEGVVIGGRYLTTLSIEGEYTVYGNWGAALFADAGGVADDPGPSLSTGVGIGLRYRAPVGSLQLDLAHPMDGDESSIRIHIGVRVGL